MLTFGSQQVVPPIFAVDVWSFRSLNHQPCQGEMQPEGESEQKSYHAARSVPNGAPLANGARVEVNFCLLDVWAWGR